MRMRSLVAATATFVGLASFAFAGDDPKSPWDGYGVGTTVTMKSTTKMSMEGAPEMTTQSRQTLVKVTDDAYVVKMEQENAGTWTGQDVTIPRKAVAGTGTEGPKPEDLGEEKVTVDGQTLDCKKTKVTASGVTTIQWTHEKHGTVKSETTGPGEQKTTMETTKLAAKFTVAGKDFECREQVSSTKAAGSETTTTMLYCDKMPGGLAKMESTSVSNGMTVKQTTEVTALEIK
jgi:hypothetical protein